MLLEMFMPHQLRSHKGCLTWLQAMLIGPRKQYPLRAGGPC